MKKPHNPLDHIPPPGVLRVALGDAELHVTRLKILLEVSERLEVAGLKSLPPVTPPEDRS